MNKLISNPGSKEAIKKGCTCPVIDNHFGKGVPSKDGPLFWFSSLCSYHQQYPIIPEKPPKSAKSKKDKS